MAGGRFLATALAGWRADANDGPQVFGQGDTKGELRCLKSRFSSCSYVGGKNSFGRGHNQGSGW
eukprot:257761-Lingulodinium_polyedra.AAC.1